MTYAKVIADSISSRGDRLTTMEVRFHRLVLAEFNTHRAFSRNSASSRAIPVQKQIDMVLEDPAIPLIWATEQPGMQGGEPLSADEEQAAEWLWLQGRDNAVETVQDFIRWAEEIDIAPVHKSILNRILEPFMWHKVIVSSTEWDNFFEQRCSPLAQPEIQAVALLMRDALNESEPTTAAIHAPYVSAEERAQLPGAQALAISAARCARVSYLTHDGIRDPQKDVELYRKLVTADPPHWSPLEHVAFAWPQPTPGNFDGWLQLRHDANARKAITDWMSAQ